MDAKKFSMILFIVGFLIAVFSGSFEVLPEMQIVRIVALVFLGVVVGLLSLDDKNGNNFLLSSVAFVICSKAIMAVMEEFELLGNLALMLNNLILFIAPAAVIISLKNVLTFAYEPEPTVSSNSIFDERSFIEKIWDSILLISVSFVFIILILESFFDVSKIQTYLSYLDYGITVIFVVDLLILFKKSSSIKDYFKSNWIDILAVLPLGFMFRAAKVIRAVRIVKIFSKSSKVSKLGKVLAKSNQSLKIFSKNSGFNEYVKPGSTKKSSKKK